MFSNFLKYARLSWGYLVTGLLSVAVAIFILINFQDRIPSPQLGAKAEAPDLQPQTEQIFLNGISSLPDKNSEWWAARVDHRLLAQAVLNCALPDNVQITSVPRHYYRALLLDLTPNGDHAFATNSPSEAASLASVEKNTPPLRLGNDEVTLLGLSDSIARARIAAADGASVNVPWVQRLGIAAVVISALATLFVTLQGRMRAVELDDGQRKEMAQSAFYKRVSYLLFGAGSGFRWVAFFAIGLSIAGTSLAGLKLVYDPTRTLTQNTRSLLQLRQLHQAVALKADCTDHAIAKPQETELWIESLRRLRGTVLPEYGAYAALDLGGTANPRPDEAHEEAVSHSVSDAHPAAKGDAAATKGNPAPATAPAKDHAPESEGKR
jgi:hypothetical protein